MCVFKITINLYHSKSLARKKINLHIINPMTRYNHKHLTWKGIHFSIASRFCKAHLSSGQTTANLKAYLGHICGCRFHQGNPTSWSLISHYKRLHSVVPCHHHPGCLHSNRTQSTPLCEMAVDPYKKVHPPFNRFCFWDCRVSSHPCYQKRLVQEPVFKTFNQKWFIFLFTFMKEIFFLTLVSCRMLPLNYE